MILFWAFQVVLVVKNLLANARDLRDAGLIPGLGRSPGGRYANPVQDSCLKIPIDSSPPGSSVPGILQARTLEWVVISSVV